MADTLSTPSEIRAELKVVKRLVAELPIQHGVLETLEGLQNLAAAYFGTHPRWNEFVQAANRMVISNG